MVKSAFRCTVRVTGKTLARCINIALNPLMFLIHVGPVVLVTAYTCKNSIIARNLVAGAAVVIPLVAVFAAVNGEILTVVVESSGSPPNGSVAVLTRLRKLRADVVGVLSILIVGKVTSVTLVRSVRPSGGMAVGTLGCSVPPGEREIHNGVIKCRGRPADISMAL